MIEALNVIKIRCTNNHLFCLLHDLYLKIKILNYDKSYFLKAIKKIKIFVVFDFSNLNQLAIYGFKTKDEQVIFKQFLKIKNVNFKTSFKILNTFSLVKLQQIAQLKDYTTFKKKLNFKETKIDAIFKTIKTNKDQVHKLERYELKIIENLVSYGFLESIITTTLKEIKQTTNYSKLSFQTKINLLLTTIVKNEAKKT